jgi:hypothetical protein
MVRRDIRAFAVSAAILVAAYAVMALWLLDVLDSTGRAVVLVLGVVAFGVSFVAWATHDRHIRERLFVLAPALAAALPIGLSVGGPPGLMVSFALALLATWAWMLSRHRPA